MILEEGIERSKHMKDRVIAYRCVGFVFLC